MRAVQADTQSTGWMNLAQSTVEYTPIANAGWQVLVLTSRDSLGEVVTDGLFTYSPNEIQVADHPYSAITPRGPQPRR
jgi:hypothetical protein